MDIFFYDGSYYDRGVYLNDGTFEPMFDVEEDFARMLNEHLGKDAEMTFRAIVYENSHTSDTGEDYEAIADEYLQDILSYADELDAIRDDLEEILDKDRLSRKDLEAVFKSLKQLSHDIRFNT